VLKGKYTVAPASNRRSGKVSVKLRLRIGFSESSMAALSVPRSLICLNFVSFDASHFYENQFLIISCLILPRYSYHATIKDAKHALSLPIQYEVRLRKRTVDIRGEKQLIFLLSSMN